MDGLVLVNERKLKLSQGNSLTCVIMCTTKAVQYD